MYNRLKLYNQVRQQRYNIKFYVGCEEVISQYITDTCGLTGFTKDEVLTALGLFEVLGLPLQNGAKGFYPELARVRHSCLPNTYLSVQADGSLLVKASVGLEAGAEVTRSRVDVLRCHQFRRRELAKDFFTDCACDRCGDGTELGTDFGSIVGTRHK